MTEFLLLFFVFVGELGLAAVVYLASAITPEYAVAGFFAVYFLDSLLYHPGRLYRTTLSGKKYSFCCL